VQTARRHGSAIQAVEACGELFADDLVLDGDLMIAVVMKDASSQHTDEVRAVATYGDRHVTRRAR
jgi:hypothetical protein